MKLLLTSNGIKPTFEKEFLALLDKNPSKILASFITTAAYGETDDPNWLSEYKRQLQNYKIANIEDLDVKDKSQKELEKFLGGKDIIFVNGGNTFYLLDWVKRSGFDK